MCGYRTAKDLGASYRDGRRDYRARRLHASRKNPGSEHSRRGKKYQRVHILLYHILPGSPWLKGSCGIPDAITVGDIADKVVMIMLQDFMDPWTFNQKNLMKCCKEFLLPGGKQIPFCAYNTMGYREQARLQLDGMEPNRRRARASGTAYEVQPVTFSFHDRK